MVLIRTGKPNVDEPNIFKSFLILNYYKFLLVKISPPCLFSSGKAGKKALNNNYFVLNTNKINAVDQEVFRFYLDSSVYRENAGDAAGVLQIAFTLQ